MRKKNILCFLLPFFKITVFSLEKQNKTTPHDSVLCLAVFYLQSFAVSFCRHDPVVFVFSPPQAPVKPDIHNLKEQTQTTSHEMWDTAFLVYSLPDIHHPLTRHAVMHY